MPSTSTPPELDQLITRTAAMIRAQFQGESSGHDWFHIERVWKLARRIAVAEGANVAVTELAALLHDVADWKFHGGDDEAGPQAARNWLLQQQAPQPLIDAIVEIVRHVSFKGAGVATPMPSLEGRCVQDADRLDAIGAVGIGRAFAFGGKFGRVMYDPEQPPQQHHSFADYKTKSGPTLNHFYEKLLLLREQMQTATGRQVAAARHQFLEQFLAQFLTEWDGADALDADQLKP